MTTIEDIKVRAGFYSFRYKIWVNGKVRRKKEYQSSHSWHDFKKFRRELKCGYATQLAIEDTRLFETNINKVRLVKSDKKIHKLSHMLFTPNIVLDTLNKRQVKYK